MCLNKFINRIFAVFGINKGISMAITAMTGIIVQRNKPIRDMKVIKNLGDSVTFIFIPYSYRNQHSQSLISNPLGIRHRKIRFHKQPTVKSHHNSKEYQLKFQKSKGV